MGDELRREEGANVLARRTLNRLNQLNRPENIVIEGIRNTAEVEF